ncbi:type IV secretion system protein virB10, partial [Striga asiatica]
MISLKSIQPFTPNHIPPTLPEKEAFRKRKPIIVLCTTANKSSGNSDDKTPGDTRKQELLARIAMLEAQKVQLADYLDERSAYLTRFAEEANAEIDQIGENAL